MLLFGLTLFMAMIGFYFLSKGQSFLERAIAVLGLPIAEAVAGFVALGLGWLAHAFKRWKQSWYGVGEISFGIATAILATSKWTRITSRHRWLPSVRRFTSWHEDSITPEKPKRN
jgi:hypothetical protein